MNKTINKTGYGIVACYQKDWNYLEKELGKMAIPVSSHFFTMGGKSLMWFEYKIPDKDLITQPMNAESAPINNEPVPVGE